jgi:mRNA interferase RelE/StbE
LSYHIVVKSSARRELLRLAKSVQPRIDAAILSLADNPRRAGATKLAGSADLYRIRVGDWRVVYHIDDATRVVEIRIVAHRRDVYRGL